MSFILPTLWAVVAAHLFWIIRKGVRWLYQKWGKATPGTHAWFRYRTIPSFREEHPIRDATNFEILEHSGTDHEVFVHKMSNRISVILCLVICGLGLITTWIACLPSIPSEVIHWVFVVLLPVIALVACLLDYYHYRSLLGAESEFSAHLMRLEYPYFFGQSPEGANPQFLANMRRSMYTRTVIIVFAFRMVIFSSLVGVIAGGVLIGGILAIDWFKGSILEVLCRWVFWIGVLAIPSAFAVFPFLPDWETVTNYCWKRKRRNST